MRLCLLRQFLAISRTIPCSSGVNRIRKISIYHHSKHNFSHFLCCSTQKKSNEFESVVLNSSRNNGNYVQHHVASLAIHSNNFINIQFFHEENWQKVLLVYGCEFLPMFQWLILSKYWKKFKTFTNYLHSLWFPCCIEKIEKPNERIDGFATRESMQRVKDVAAIQYSNALSFILSNVAFTVSTQLKDYLLLFNIKF